MDELTLKLCKVCNVTRQTYGLAVDSLGQLRVKGREVLGFSPDTTVSVVLEDDGTFVEDETYFLCLPSNTKFMLLRETERWMPGYTDEHTAWLTGESASTSVDVVDSTEAWHSAAHQLKHNLASIVLMSEEELQSLVDAPVAGFGLALGVPERKARTLQDALQRVLDRREEERQSKELLKLYMQVMQKEHEQPLQSEGEKEMDEIDGTEEGTHTGISKRTLQILKEETRPETKLSNKDLQTVLDEGVQSMNRMLGWDVSRITVLLQACEEELNTRLQRVQAIHSLTSVSPLGKSTDTD